MEDNGETREAIRVIGLMSGTSLDGLDIALCSFNQLNGKWSYQIEKTACVEYDSGWKNKLIAAYSTPISALVDLNVEYGQWLGKRVNDFLKGEGRPDLICSHGHTIHHAPANGVTYQLGNGRSIAEITGIRTIFDFRSKDVSLGGQGAPLVPIGDRLLFPEFDGCLNLGGFSNISFEKSGTRIAFDICPVNIILNALSEKLGEPFDENGEMARSGNLNEKLLASLLETTNSKEDRPSLSREWVEKNIDPILAKSQIPIADQMNALVEFMAINIGNVIRENQLKSVLVTGGGGYNSYLMDRLSAHVGFEINMADHLLIDYKEALTFGFLGVLRWYGLTNVLKSVTGATSDSVSGEIASA